MKSDPLCYLYEFSFGNLKLFSKTAPHYNRFNTGLALRMRATSLPSYQKSKLNPQQLFYMTPGRVKLIKLFSNLIY